MNKYVFWSVINQHINIALTEDLSRYAQGETFWQAMQNLCETLKKWIPSSTNEETDINSRLKMYHETGINKVEILVEAKGDRFAVKCSNTRSHIQAESERDALLKYVAAKAKTSVINTGNITKEINLEKSKKLA